MPKKKTKKTTKKTTVKKQVTKQPKKKITQGLAIVSLILNILILPGLGTLIGGKTKDGTYQLIIFLGSFLIGFLLTVTIIGAVIGIPLIIIGPIAAWIWGIVSGVQLIEESEK
ncbi:hypothetical protein GF386_02355 [Candidatus Pacearchaeota archaeon]|nr:hypothetical protein [Candidatus Pacearchaeota archaeon]MBD3282999.1 hypothetical protein [Candidatus Pacearchaeota archaeon]